MVYNYQWRIADLLGVLADGMPEIPFQNTIFVLPNGKGEIQLCVLPFPGDL